MQHSGLGFTEQSAVERNIFAVILSLSFGNMWWTRLQQIATRFCIHSAEPPKAWIDF